MLVPGAPRSLRDECAASWLAVTALGLTVFGLSMPPAHGAAAAPTADDTPAAAETPTAGAAPADDDHLSIGPGAYFIPSHPGARTMRGVAIPFIDAEYAGRLYSNAEDLLGIYAYKSADTQIGAAFEYDLTERLGKDDERFRDLRDVRETTRFKLFAARTVSFVTGDANVATDMAGHGQGTLAQANLWFSAPVNPRLLLSAGPGVTWADARYLHSFFGITGAQAAVAPFPAYAVREGVTDLHGNALATYDLSSRWSIGVAEYVAHLRGSAEGSPVTSSRRQATSLAWLAYKWR